MSGRLPEIYSDDVNKFLRSSTPAPNLFFYMWTGLNDIDKKGSFVWPSTHQPPSYTHWERDQPDGDKRGVISAGLSTV